MNNPKYWDKEKYKKYKIMYRSFFEEEEDKLAEWKAKLAARKPGIGLKKRTTVVKALIIVVVKTMDVVSLKYISNP